MWGCERGAASVGLDMNNLSCFLIIVGPRAWGREPGGREPGAASLGACVSEHEREWSVSVWGPQWVCGSGDVGLGLRAWVPCEHGRGAAGIIVLPVILGAANVGLRARGCERGADGNTLSCFLLLI
jgi:hypothetical protein